MSNHINAYSWKSSNESVYQEIYPTLHKISSVVEATHVQENRQEKAAVMKLPLAKANCCYLVDGKSPKDEVFKTYLYCDKNMKVLTHILPLTKVEPLAVARDRCIPRLN